MAELAWDRLPPEKPCSSPDGHEHVDVMSMRSFVPTASFCPNCGQPWHIVVLPRDDV